MVKTGIFVLAIAGLVLTGCMDNSVIPDEGTPPLGVTNEDEAMEYYALRDEFVVNASRTFSDDAIEGVDGGPGIVVEEIRSQGIIPVAWGRFVEEVFITATTKREAGDSVAVVNLQRDISGTFRILAKYNEDDSTLFLIEKPFDDESERNIVFKRIGREVDRFWLNWTPVAISLVEGSTVEPPADQEMAITEITFEGPDGTVITVTDPTSHYLRYRWRNVPLDRAVGDVPEMSTGNSFTVRATVVSASPDTDLVTLRFGFTDATRHREGMALMSSVENDDGTYTRVYEKVATIAHQPGYFHAGVVAITKKTLFDDDPMYYSVSWWGVPYKTL